MTPKYVLAGTLQRNTILPIQGNPAIDIPGGDLLYTAAGLLIWSEDAGLLARAGDDFPHEWLQILSKHGLDIKGIKILPETMDLRNFITYNDKYEPLQSNPISQFSQRGLPLPKQLSNYKRPVQALDQKPSIDPASPRPADIPGQYLNAKSVHLCAMEFASVNRMVSTFQEKGTAVLTLDPAPEWMHTKWWPQISLLVNGLTAFLPSEKELKTLFWSKTSDLLEMTQAISSENCPYVVVKCGVGGQIVYDGLNHKRWHVPAYPVEIKDPTGAGAAFCGGFLAGFELTGDPLQATLMGNISASLTMEGTGIFHILEAQTELAKARMDSLKSVVREL